MSLPTSVTDRRFEQLRRLTELSRALTYTTAPDEVLRLAADRAAELLDARSTLLMLSDEDGMLRIRAARGVREGALERFSARLDETLIQRLHDLLDAPHQGAFLGVPLVVHGAVTGLLAVVRSEDKSITEEEEWLLSAVADLVAVALENARLEEEVRRERESRAQAIQDAGRADETNEMALATLSHDLRSPLNAIDSYAELIEMEILGPVSDRQREALGRIRMSGRHLLAVLENVLEMTRLSAGVVRVQAASVPVSSVVEEAVLMVRPSAKAKDQTLVVDPAPELTVHADPNRLRQVLVNLLGNAIKYTQPTGTIRVSTTVSEVGGARWGLVAVSDSGPGIPTEKLQAIFQPYYRLPTTEGDGSEGAGLGLAISRELVRHMGGEIHVESELGRGCTFTVRLPVRSDAVRAAGGAA